MLSSGSSKKPSQAPQFNSLHMLLGQWYLADRRIVTYLVAKRLANRIANENNQ